METNYKRISLILKVSDQGEELTMSHMSLLITWQCAST